MSAILFENFNLSEGVQLGVSPYLNKPGECRKGQNCDFKEVGTLARFPGYEKHGNAIAASDILGLYDFKTIAGGMKWLAVNGTVLYSDESGTWTSRKTGLTTGKNAEFVTHLDTVIMVNGADAPIKSTDGVTWAALGGSPPVAKYAVTFNNSVYLLNISGNTSRIRWSDDGTIETWTATNIQDIVTNIGIGDQITGGIVGGGSATSSKLFVFKNYSTWTWDTYELKTIHPSVGATASRSIATIDEWVFWLSHKGVYTSNGGKPLKISKPVQAFIDGMTSITTPVGWTEDNMYYLYIGTSNGVTNCVLIYDYESNVWSYKPLQDVVKVATTLITSGGVRSSYIGDSLGQVFKFRTGNDDDGEPIQFWWEGALNTSQYPDRIKEYEYLYVFMDYTARTGIDVFYSLDFGKFKPLGTAKEIVSELPFPIGTKGHNIRIAYGSNLKVAQQRIYGHLAIGKVEPGRIGSVK